MGRDRRIAIFSSPLLEETELNGSTHTKSWRDVAAGSIFLVIGAAFAVGAMNYQLGTPLRMGPGFMPLLLAVLLVALGLVVIVTGMNKTQAAQSDPVAWRGIGLVVASLAVFGLFARPLGLMPIVFLCTFLTALASRSNTVLSASAIALAMSALCYLIFKTGLGIALPTFGPLFAF